MPKIDKQGNFPSHPGITVISDINQKSLQSLLPLYNALASNPLITKYYSVLPLHCWHMTNINLFTRAGLKLNDEQWRNYLISNAKVINRYASTIQDMGVAHTVSATGIGMSHSLHLSINVPVSQQVEVYSLAYRLDRKLCSKVPRNFHITLAYKYNEPSKNDLAKIQHYCNNIFKYNMQGKIIKLSPPSLCHFQSMNSGYQPWLTTSPIKPPIVQTVTRHSAPISPSSKSKRVEQASVTSTDSKRAHLKQ